MIYNPTSGFVVTPSDTAENAGTSLYVGGTGNVNLVLASGQTVLFSAVPVGTTLNVQFQKVKSTSTTATLMVALT